MEGSVSEAWNRVSMIAPVKKFDRVRLSTCFKKKKTQNLNSSISREQPPPGYIEIYRDISKKYTGYFILIRFQHLRGIILGTNTSIKFKRILKRKLYTFWDFAMAVVKQQIAFTSFKIAIAIEFSCFAV